MTAYAVLLRGVNVGGRGALPMATFREVLTGLGYEHVRTYLQSGNAVLGTSHRAQRVADDVQRALREAAGREIEVLVRSSAQLRQVVHGWPFEPDAPPATKHVTFLRTEPDAGALRDVAAEAFAPERFALDGAHLYLSVPGGLGRSKLAPVVGRKLAGAVTTTRNWNTVTALADLTEALG